MDRIACSSLSLHPQKGNKYLVGWWWNCSHCKYGCSCWSWSATSLQQWNTPKQPDQDSSKHHYRTLCAFYPFNKHFVPPCCWFTSTLFHLSLIKRIFSSLFATNIYCTWNKYCTLMQAAGNRAWHNNSHPLLITHGASANLRTVVDCVVVPGAQEKLEQHFLQVSPASP